MVCPQAQERDAPEAEIEPVDDIRAGNPSSHPELLERLTDEFVQSGFDLRALLPGALVPLLLHLQHRNNFV